MTTTTRPRRKSAPSPVGRTYNQYCGLATALDVIGARWSLLIVRELLIAPSRFGNLQQALPGVGPNLLAERLRELCVAGIVEQRPISGEGRRQLYALTEFGASLRPTVLELARWGLHLVSESPQAGDAVRSEWAMLAVEALARGGNLGDDINETYQFRVDDDLFHVVITGGRASIATGPADDYDLEVSSDAATFVQIGAGHMDPFVALTDGRVSIVGELPVALRCCALLGIAASVESAVA